MIDPNNLEAIKQSNDQAIPKERNRDRNRTPNMDDNRNAKYPMVQSQEYVGGHKLTFDSTPGHRTFELVHGSGTIVQIAEDGKTTSITVGNAHSHFKEGVTITVDQNHDVKVAGHMRLSVDGGAHIEVKGDVALMTTGDMTHFVGGNLNTVVNGDHNMHVSGKMNSTSGGDMTHTSSGNIIQKASEIHLN